MPADQSIEFLVTHSGRFHADDVLSAAVLSRLFPEASLLRSRDPRAFALDRAIVFDVGGTYDPANNLFDHHQVDAPKREDGTPYSAFGLVWRSYGMAYLAALDVDPDYAREIHARIDQDIVRPVDLLDNLVVSPAEASYFPKMGFGDVIQGMNPTFFDKGRRIEGRPAEDVRFERAMAFATEFIESHTAQIEAELHGASIVRTALRNAEGPVLILPLDVPFDAALAEEGAYHILYVVYPRDTDWALAGVRCDPETYPLRMDLPAEWAGLTGTDLAAATGVEDAVFCHRSRSLAVAGSREGVLRLADLAAPQPEVDAGFEVCA